MLFRSVPLPQRTGWLEYARRYGHLSGCRRHDGAQHRLLRRFRPDVPIGVCTRDLIFRRFAILNDRLSRHSTGSWCRSREIATHVCDGNPVAISACPEVDRIFSALYSVRPEILGPYLKLKVQELLIYLNDFQSTRKCLTQYFSQQTELIKEIHQLLTEHLDQRFTIDELSKRYLINTSTLKEVFKTV